MWPSLFFFSPCFYLLVHVRRLFVLYIVLALMDRGWSVMIRSEQRSATIITSLTISNTNNMSSSVYVNWLTLWAHQCIYVNWLWWWRRDELQLLQHEHLSSLALFETFLELSDISATGSNEFASKSSNCTLKRDILILPNSTIT